MKPSQDEFAQAKKYLPLPLNFKRGDRIWVCTPEYLYQFSLSVTTNKINPQWDKIIRCWRCRVVVKRLEYHCRMPTLGTIFTNIPRQYNKVWIDEIEPS